MRRSCVKPLCSPMISTVIMILAIGEILFDELPGGRRPGGAPFNFAQHLHRMGEEVLFVSAVGTDAAGGELMDAVRSSGLDRRLIQRDGAHATGRVEVSLDEHGVPDYTIIEDVAYDHIDFKKLPALPKVDLLYFGSLIQRTPDGRKRLQQFLREQPSSVLRFYDVNFRHGCDNPDILIPSLEQTDLLKLNEDELAAAGEMIGSSLQGDALAAQLMEQFGIRQIAMTRGARGSTLYCGAQKFEEPAGAVTKEQIVDTVGAGDAFASVLARCILNETDPQTMLRQATALAEQVCTIAGAVPADDRFYDKIQTGQKESAS
jgi:fructokinase